MRMEEDTKDAHDTADAIYHSSYDTTKTKALPLHQTIDSWCIHYD